MLAGDSVNSKKFLIQKEINSDFRVLNQGNHILFSCTLYAVSDTLFSVLYRDVEVV